MTVSRTLALALGVAVLAAIGVALAAPPSPPTTKVRSQHGDLVARKCQDAGSCDAATVSSGTGGAPEWRDARRRQGFRAGAASTKGKK
jgi:hypothetical protein